MPAISLDEVLILERQSERLGLLWRSQGQKFLDEQAAALQDDVERLRASYLVLAESVPADARPKRRVRVPRVIDLRDPAPEIVDRVCCTDGHNNVAADTSCSRCHEVYCRRCILQSSATHDKPLCTECALIVSGVHHKRTRPAAASARSKR
jgi:hypothetical protein